MLAPAALAAVLSGYPRPAWMDEGFLGASFMEPLTFILRRGGQPVDAIERYHRERGPETLRKLKDIGVNVVIVNVHKGAGLQAEAEDIQSARKLIELAHSMGMRASGYIGASLMYETIFDEIPE